MKKILYASLILFPLFAFVGCIGEPPEELMDNNAITIHDYDIDYNRYMATSDSSVLTSSAAISQYSETVASLEFITNGGHDDLVPNNYKKVSDNIYAVMENGEISGYMNGTYDKKNKKWTWIECDIQGKILTTIATKATTVKTTYTASTKEAITEETDTFTPETDPPYTQPPITDPITEKNTKKIITHTKKTTPTTIKLKNFEWTKISQSQCPSEVLDYFDDCIAMNNAACKQIVSGECNYVLIKAKKGYGVKITTITDSGQIKYRVSDSGENYVIIKFNQDKTATYLQQ